VEGRRGHVHQKETDDDIFVILSVLVGHLGIFRVRADHLLWLGSEDE